jgi:thiamine kinase-like enzyme
VCDQLLPQLRGPAGPLRPLHGDAHAHNLIPTADGLLWNDFEDTCKGPIAWDLSGVIGDEGEVAAAYPNAPDSMTLEPYRQARRLHATVWVYALLPEVPEWAELAEGMLVDLRSHV